MVKLLGLIDLFAAIILISSLMEFELPVEFFFFVIILLLVKASIAITDPGGITDILVASVIVFSLFFSIPTLIYILGFILATIKGISSLAAG